MNGRGHRVRRIVMWAAGVVLGVSILLWGVSMFHIYWVGPSLAYRVGVGSGAAHFVLAPENGQYAPRPGWNVDGWISWEHLWRPGRIRATPQALITATFVPLWIPAAVGAIAVLAAWRVGHRERALAMIGHCPTCGYDLTGIGGVCPECGGER